MLVTEEHFEDRGDLYYTGPLRQAQDFIKQSQWVNERSTDSGGYEVTIGYSAEPEEPSQCAEWGRGKTLTEAWRYALGAAFGPLDGEFQPVDIG